jgi:hypothetical protein
MRTRDEVWLALDHSFKQFMDTLGRLTEDELTHQAVVGKWTVKDVVSHIWSRIDEAVLTAKAWTGKRPWQEGVTFDDAWNERQVTDRGALPLITTVDGLTAAHRRMMHFLDQVDDEALMAKGKTTWGEEMTLIDFLYTFAEHYDEHAADLKKYQDDCLEGCD